MDSPEPPVATLVLNMGLFLELETCLKSRDDLRFCLESSPGEQVQLAQGLDGLAEPATGVAPPKVFIEDNEFFIFKVFCLVLIFSRSSSIAVGTLIRV